MEWMALLIPFVVGLAVAWFLTGNPLFGVVGGVIAVLLSLGVVTLGFDWTKLLGVVTGATQAATTTLAT